MNWRNLRKGSVCSLSSPTPFHCLVSQLSGHVSSRFQRASWRPRLPPAATPPDKPRHVASCVWPENQIILAFFFSLSHSSITVLPGISSTSCYAVAREEAAFSSSDPRNGQHVDLILGRDLLAPEVVLRVIRLWLSPPGFVLKPFWSICPHFCHEPLRRSNSLQVFLWAQKLEVHDVVKMDRFFAFNLGTLFTLKWNFN